MNIQKLIKLLNDTALEYQLKSDKEEIGNPDRTFDLGVAFGLMKAQSIILNKIIDEKG